jgi:MSHA biogenesis protein MshI
MQFFKKKAKSNSRVGALVSSEQLAVVHMGERDGAPYLIDFKRVALNSEKDAGQALSNLVKTMEIEGKQCSFVLNRKDYNLHLVEAPKVEASELRGAVRWKIKDLLDMKVEDAAIDVFRVPDDYSWGRCWNPSSGL